MAALLSQGRLARGFVIEEVGPGVQGPINPEGGPVLSYLRGEVD